MTFRIRNLLFFTSSIIFLTCSLFSQQTSLNDSNVSGFSIVEKYNILADAIVNKKQVVLIYKGYKREVCPHKLGSKHQTKRVLVFQFAGGSESGLPPEGGWRCLFLDKIEILEVREGKWYPDKSYYKHHPHKQNQTCIDQVEVQATF